MFNIQYSFFTLKVLKVLSPYVCIWTFCVFFKGYLAPFSAITIAIYFHFKCTYHRCRVRNNSRSSLWRRDFSEYFQPNRLKILWKVSPPQWWPAVISNPAAGYHQWRSIFCTLFCSWYLTWIPIQTWFFTCPASYFPCSFGVSNLPTSASLQEKSLVYRHNSK